MSSSIASVNGAGHQHNGTEDRKFGDMRDYMGPNLFQPHLARQAIRDAHEAKIPKLVGYYAGLASVPNTRWLAPMGWDFNWIDWEHSAMNVETMTTLTYAGRVPSHDESTIAFALDAGASIVAPHVDTVAQAKHLASAVKFGTKHRGIRSAPPFRYVQHLTDTALEPEEGFWLSLNKQAALMIQIETLEGIQNLDAILSEVPEIDAAFFGQLDCRTSMGLISYHGIKGTEPEWLEAVDLFHDTIKKHKKPFAGFAFGEGETLRQGASKMCMCMVSGDTVALAGMRQPLAAAREAFLPTTK
ncbi:MAG: hypothetical protein M1828_001128 [Chrysothrix sp. TS-e1954]|nr:MAG: hypothetical protein M1828_001128 [Chrysothrix sp. TS-e1954]